MSERLPVGWVRTPRSSEILRVPVSDFVGGPHTLVTGRSGSGKSMWILGLVLWLFVHRPDVHQVYFDAKGIDAERLLGWLPVVGSADDAQNIAVVSPWSEVGTPALNMLAPDPYLEADLQAGAVADAFELLAGEPLGGRMRPALVSTVLAVMDALGGDATLIEVLRALEDPAFARSLGGRCGGPESRRYLVEVLPSENRSTLTAITARLRGLLTARRIAGLLAGSPECLRGEELLATRLSVVNAGASKTGHGGQVARMIAGYVLHLVTTAVFTRAQRTPLVIWIDEFQSLTSQSAQADLEAGLQKARAFRASYVLITQGLGQLRSATLTETILTNCSRWLTLSPRDELRHLDRVLPPPTGRVLDPTSFDGRVLAPDAERRALLAALGRLGNRQGVYADLARGTSHVLASTPNIPVAQLDERAAGVSPALRHAFERGRFGRPIETLVAGAQARSTGLAAVASREPGEPSASSGRPRRARPPVRLPR